MSRPSDPPIGRSSAADTHAAEADDHARDLAGRAAAPSDFELDRLFTAVDRFHAASFEASPDLRIHCAAGCSACCSQMVFDVQAFEIDRIGRRLVVEGRGDEVRERLEARLCVYDEVRRRVPHAASASADDATENVAIEFWKRDLPCALLAADGTCSVHDIRPWSCRRSFAANEPELCLGSTARDPRRRFFTLAPSEDFERDLAVLDRHAAFDVDTDLLDRGLIRWLEAKVPPTSRG